MTKRADPATLQRRHWRKALAIARILFEEDGYHTAYIDEIQAFIAAQSADTQPMQGEPATAPPPAAPAESRYRIERYPHSRFWAVRDGEDLVAVTAYRKGAQEVTDRLQAQERTIAELQRQLAALSMTTEPGRPDGEATGGRFPQGIAANGATGNHERPRRQAGRRRPGAPRPCS